jgi:hypothetical protein
MRPLKPTSRRRSPGTVRSRSRLPSRSRPRARGVTYGVRLRRRENRDASGWRSGPGRRRSTLSGPGAHPAFAESSWRRYACFSIPSELPVRRQRARSSLSGFGGGLIATALAASYSARRASRRILVYASSGVTIRQVTYGFEPKNRLEPFGGHPWRERYGPSFSARTGSRWPERCQRRTACTGHHGRRPSDGPSGRATSGSMSSGRGRFRLPFDSERRGGERRDPPCAEADRKRVAQAKWGALIGAASGTTLAFQHEQVGRTARASGSRGARRLVEALRRAHRGRRRR